MSGIPPGVAAVRTLSIVITVLALLPLVAAARTPDIEASIAYAPQPVQPGQFFDLTVTLENSGDPGVITLEIVEEYPFTVIETQDLDRAQRFTLRNTQTLQFRLRVAPDANDGLTQLRIRYAVDEGAMLEEEFDINIETFDAQVDVTRVEQIPVEMAPGERGEMLLTIQNRADTPLENVDVILDLTDSYDTNANMENMIAVQAMLNARLEEVNRRVAAGLSPLRGATPMGVQSGSREPTAFAAFAPVEMSTHQRLGTLLPGESVQVSFRIQALPNAQSSIHAIPVYINYNDEENNPFHTRVEVPAIINEPSDLLITLKESSLRTTDFAGSVTFSIANRGTSVARSTAVLLNEANYTIITAPETVYLGDIAPGEERTATFEVLPEDDELQLPVTVSYRDAFNQQHADTVTLAHEIINPNYYRDMNYEMMIVWIILGVVILALTLFYVGHLRKVTG